MLRWCESSLQQTKRIALQSPASPLSGPSRFPFARCSGSRVVPGRNELRNVKAAPFPAIPGAVAGIVLPGALPPAVTADAKSVAAMLPGTARSKRGSRTLKSQSEVRGRHAIPS